MGLPTGDVKSIYYLKCFDQILKSEIQIILTLVVIAVGRRILQTKYKPVTGITAYQHKII